MSWLDIKIDLQPLLWPLTLAVKRIHKSLSLFKKAMGTMLLSTRKILVYLLWSYEPSSLGPLFYRNWQEISIWWIHPKAAGFLSRKVSWSSSLIILMSLVRQGLQLVCCLCLTEPTKVKESWNYKLSSPSCRQTCFAFSWIPGQLWTNFVQE